MENGYFSTALYFGTSYQPVGKVFIFGLFEEASLQVATCAESGTITMDLFWVCSGRHFAISPRALESKQRVTSRLWVDHMFWKSWIGSREEAKRATAEREAGGRILNVEATTSNVKLLASALDDIAARGA